MFFPFVADSDVRAEGYIPRATYSEARDGCAHCGAKVALKFIGSSGYCRPCHRAEKRAIRETEDVLERAGLGRRRP